MARLPNHRSLTDLYVRKVKPEATPFNVWDLKARGLVLRVQPSGRRASSTSIAQRAAALVPHR